MNDPTDEILRHAVAERVKSAPSPRPFHALDDASKERRTNTRWIETFGGNRQRGLLVGAIACIAVVLGVAGLSTLNADDNTVLTDAAVATSLTSATTPEDSISSDPTESDVDGVTTTRPTATTAEETTTVETTTSTAAPIQSTSVTVTCADGGSVDYDVPGDDEGQIDDVINSIDFCEGSGGLASVTFTGCRLFNPRPITIQANNSALPDFDTLDYCEE